MNGSDDLPAALREGHPLLGLGYAQPIAPRPLTRLEDDRAAPGDAVVAEEVPVSLVYNRRPHVVMMTSPAQLEDFATGFTLTEGIVQSAKEIEGIEVVKHAQGIEILITVAEPRAEQLKSRGRSLIGRTGCGLCGVESIQDALRELPHLAPGPTFSAEALWRVEAELPRRQTWNHETGSLHAAAFAARDGSIELVREDIGRHNALDKVAGALARCGRDPRDGFVALTSRASYELVQKAVAMGAPLMTAVSRPTGLAIRLAEASGLTLVALLRGRSANVYTHPERIR